MPGQGLLLVMTDIPADVEQEFNRWQNEAHVRDALTVPGVLAARRYRAAEGKPKYLAMYDLEDPGVAEKPEYQKVSAGSPQTHPSSAEISKKSCNTMRALYQLLLALPTPEPTDVSAARALLLRGISWEPEHNKEMDDWYNTEHLPNLSRVPGVLRARRYTLAPGATALTGDPPAYMAVYELERREVLSTPTFQKAVETPWTNQVRPFFRAPELRNVYDRIFPA